MIQVFGRINRFFSDGFIGFDSMNTDIFIAFLVLHGHLYSFYFRNFRIYLVSPGYISRTDL